MLQRGRIGCVHIIRLNLQRGIAHVTKFLIGVGTLVRDDDERNRWVMGVLDSPVKVKAWTDENFENSPIRLFSKS
jgi:hypothetical protein